MKQLCFISKSQGDRVIFNNEITRILSDFKYHLDSIDVVDHYTDQIKDFNNINFDKLIYINNLKSILLNSFNKNNNNKSFIIESSIISIKLNNNNNNDDETKTTTVVDIPLTDNGITYITQNFTKYNQSTATISIDLMYTDDGTTIKSFNTILNGIIYNNINNNNNSQTLKNIFKLNDNNDNNRYLEDITNNFITSNRYQCYLEVSEIARDHDYNGLFELHITVHHDGTDKRLEQFKSLCDQLNCKPVLIELPKGESRTQMMTASYHRGSIKEIQILGYKMSKQFINQGFRITRVKIEAMFSNPSVPQTVDELVNVSPCNYFEFHIKLSLPCEADLEVLNKLVGKHDAHLSRNAFRVHDDGVTQRFVTLRMYGVGKDVAEQCYDSCVSDIESNGFTIASRMREYSIYDTNVNLDKGWI